MLNIEGSFIVVVGRMTSTDIYVAKSKVAMPLIGSISKTELKAGQDLVSTYDSDNSPSIWIMMIIDLPPEEAHR